MTAPLLVTAAILLWVWMSARAHRKRMEHLRSRYPWMRP